MQCGTGHYKNLMAQFSTVVEVFLQLDEQYQEVIADITQRMGAGMAKFIELEVRTALAATAVCCAAAVLTPWQLQDAGISKVTSLLCDVQDALCHELLFEAGTLITGSSCWACSTPQAWSDWVQPHVSSAAKIKNQQAAAALAQAKHWHVPFCPICILMVHLPAATACAAG